MLGNGSDDLHKYMVACKREVERELSTGLNVNLDIGSVIMFQGWVVC